jgi:hypothetical protein
MSSFNVTAHSDESHTEDQRPVAKLHTTLLPKIQLGILLALVLAEPITSTVIYPFINQVTSSITGGPAFLFTQ